MDTTDKENNTGPISEEEIARKWEAKKAEIEKSISARGSTVAPVASAAPRKSPDDIFKEWESEDSGVVSGSVVETDITAVSPALTGKTAEPEPLVLDVDDDEQEPSLLSVIQGLKNQQIAGADIAPDVRQDLILLLRQKGMTQEEIAAMLRISRRTVIRDIKAAHARIGSELSTDPTYILAGEIRNQCQGFIDGAIKEKAWRTASRIQKDMIELLQSLGIVYRAPLKTDIRALELHANLPTQQQQSGYTAYVDGVKKSKAGVESILADILSDLQQN